MSATTTYINVYRYKRARRSGERREKKDSPILLLLCSHLSLRVKHVSDIHIPDLADHLQDILYLILGLSRIVMKAVQMMDETFRGLRMTGLGVGQLSGRDSRLLRRSSNLLACACLDQANRIERPLTSCNSCA